MHDWDLDCSPPAEQGQVLPQGEVPSGGPLEHSEPATAGETPDNRPLPHPVTGIGVSVAGVEACIELFSNLAPDTGMAFVVIPQFADRQSYLVELLSHHTPMPVAEAAEAIYPRPDHVYVLASASPRPIDRFLNSLAASQKSRAVGVVLSGTHADGALGLRAIKSEGGIAILQSPDSAGPGEPWRNSISLDYVDRILPADQIAAELGRIGRQFQQASLRALAEGSLQPGGEIPYSSILGLLHGVSGIDFRVYKPAVIQRRIARRMLLEDIRSLDEYAAFLQGNAMELADLERDSLIGETRFFRDPAVFEALADTVLPRIFASRDARQPVRFWAAGCSSGEEVYSLGICLLEYLAGRPFDAPVQIFGTDVSRHAIQTARSGIFPESAVEEISPERLQRFFVKVPEGYQIAQQVRSLCIFARQDLCQDPPFSRIDLVSCRNVLTYLEPELQRQILAALHYALQPDGFLVLGKAETARPAASLFQLLDHRHKIFARVGNGPLRAEMAAAPRLRANTAVPHAAPGKWADRELRRAADRILLARYAPPGVIVDEDMRILQSRGHTSPFLEMPQGRVSLKLARMLRDGIAAPASQAVERAIEQDLPVRVEGLRVPVGDRILEIALDVLPIRTVAPRSRCFLVLFAPASPPKPDQSPEQREPSESRDRDEMVERLRQDLSLTKLHLQTLLEERDVRNRELILANQEAQAANHAVRRASQEMADIREQLQRSEEVLRAVEDLQQRNTTLAKAVDDLSNLLNSTNLPILMVGNDLDIRQFTALTQKVMNLRPQDMGRPVTDVRLNLKTAGMETLFREVLETLTSREAEVQDSEGRWYLLRARPYRTTENRIEGVVVVLVDIDQLRRGQQELSAARDFAGSLVENLPMPLAVIDRGFRIRVVNDAFRSLAGIGKGDVDGRSFPDLALALWGLGEPLRTHLENLRTSIGAGERFLFEHQTPGEKPRVLDIRGCAVKSDRETSLLVTIQDITAHKDAERFLALEGERLASEVASTARELGRTQDELRALAANLFTSQEEERRRVARELHDDISQKLALLEIDAQQVEPQIASDPAQARNELERVRGAIGDLSEDVRRISHALHPSVIEDLGVGPAIRSLVEDFRDREHMIVTFRCQNIPDGIPLEIATGLYRITQEALRNVAKHAGKTHVKVLLQGVSGRVRLQVIDAGAGFDVEARRSGLGLISTAERVRIMQGTLAIESQPGEGTRVAVDVPLP